MTVRVHRIIRHALMTITSMSTWCTWMAQPVAKILLVKAAESATITMKQNSIYVKTLVCPWRGPLEMLEIAIVMIIVPWTVTLMLAQKGSKQQCPEGVGVVVMWVMMILILVVAVMLEL